MVEPIIFSAPIPSDLTQEQVWQGLQIKARDEVGFMPAFKKCEIVPGSRNVVKHTFLRRSTMLEFHSGKEVEVVEEVTEFSPTMVSESLRFEFTLSPRASIRPSIEFYIEP